MRDPWIASILARLGYRIARGHPYQVWVRLPARPCTAALPSDAPAGVVARVRGGRLVILDPAGYLEVGAEYTVWRPWGPKVGRVETLGRLPWGGLEARLVEGEAPLWAPVGPAEWWWSILGLIGERLEAEKPWLVILAPAYTAPYRRPYTWAPHVRVPGECLGARPPPPGPGGLLPAEWCGGRLGVCGG